MNSKPITDVKIITLRSRIITTPLQRGINKRPTQKQLQKQQKKNKNDDEKDRDYEPPMKMYNSSVPDDDESTVENDFGFQEFNRFHDNNYNNNKLNGVTPTDIRDAMLEDPTVTWLKTYYSKLGYNPNPRTTERGIINNNPIVGSKRKYEESNNTSLDNKRIKVSNNSYKKNPILQKGIDFENKVIDDIKNKFSGQVAQVVFNRNLPSNNDLTFQYMKQGIPIIFQAMLYNLTNKTHGIADLLIRSDYVNKLIKEQVISPDMEHYKAPKLNGDYHYVVIDIKFSDMPLCANGITLLKSGSMPACKGQLTIYNAIIGQLQGYTPSKAYILGKSWTIKNKSQGYNCYDRLGVVDFDGFDKKYIKLTYDAINWVRYVRYDGDMQNCLNPTRSEMIPNLSVENWDWQNVKMEIAKLTESPSLISHVGVKRAKIAKSLGITSYLDKKLNANVMGFKKGGKITKLVDSILNINRDPNNIILPLKIENNFNGWQVETDFDFYIDFETFPGTLINKIDILNSNAYNPYLFMIGIWYKYNGTYQYESFIATEYSKNEEFRITNDFVNFINNHTQNAKPKLYCWSKAEETTINALNRRHNKNWLNNVLWCDIHKLFKDAPIAIKGSFSLKLKEISKAMKSHNMIQVEWPDNGIGNGQMAMDNAINYYEAIVKDNSIITNIRDYNEVDCKVVWEIVNYLRQNHTK